MAAPFTRASLVRGPGVVTYNSHYFYTREGIKLNLASAWDDVSTSLYGVVDKTKKDVVLKVGLTLWGALENLGDLFPSSILNPVVGSSVFPTNDTSLTVTGRNKDQVLFPNVAITKIANLHLGTDSGIYSADVEFTALRANSKNPEDATAYYDTTAAATFPESAFAKTNFSRTRWTAAWGTITGFTSFIGQAGFDIAWNLKTTPVTVEGWGTCDMTLDGLEASCKCVPIGPTGPQIEAQTLTQGSALGALLSSIPSTASDLTITGGSHSLVLKTPGLISHGYNFDRQALRTGEVEFVSIRGFSAGVPSAIATIS